MTTVELNKKEAVGTSFKSILKVFPRILCGSDLIYYVTETNVSRETFLQQKCLNNAIYVFEKCKNPCKHLRKSADKM